MVKLNRELTVSFEMLTDEEAEEQWKKIEEFRNSEEAKKICDIMGKIASDMYDEQM